MGRYIVTSVDRVYAEEYLRNPLAVHSHSPGLNRVLNALRSEPRAGHKVLVCTVPWKEWRLGRLPPRIGERVELEEMIYLSRADAERAVFTRRWKEVVGEELR